MVAAISNSMVVIACHYFLRIPKRGFMYLLSYFSS